ncbi:hypothetical protein GLYMA_07G195650v4 [Glycine max]|nr:hypothetical protein GLYMA_07G195650v4 [Glycine max]
MATSVYSFYLDKTEENTEKKDGDKVLNLVSCAAFSMMSLSLSRLTGLGFISFRAKDTSNISDYFASILLKKSLKVYFHQELIGDYVPPRVVEQIEKAKVSVIILSESYLDTTWCLDEGREGETPSHPALFPYLPE